MLRTYLNIAFRNLLRHRTYSLLNILGLAAGLACGILIYLTTQFHLSFDTYHARANRIYRVVSQIKHEEIRFSRGTPKPLGETLRRDYPFLEQVARLVRLNNRIIRIPNASGGYTYHIQIQGWMFLLTIGIASVITLATVSFQSVKVAFMNPVKSLKTE